MHSVNTTARGGGVRWYEFRIDKSRNVSLHQQGTYSPDGFYRWMASPAIDRAGNIGIGYSFGGTPHFAGQRSKSNGPGWPDALPIISDSLRHATHRALGMCRGTWRPAQDACHRVRK